MEFRVSNACPENLKRSWKKRRYQRLKSNETKSTKRKLKIIRLGGATRRRFWKLRRSVPKMNWKIMSTTGKLLAKFHEVYVSMMIGLANNMAKFNSKELIRGKKVAKDHEQVSMACCGEEVIDGSLVLEIYKRLLDSNPELSKL